MNKIPSNIPMESNHKEASCGRLLKTEETPVHLRDVMDAARDCGQQLAEHEWNNFVNFLAKDICKDREFAGNDFMSIMSTFAAYFVSTWTILMKRMIADRDDVVITQNDIINTFFDAVNAIVKTVRKK